MWGVGRIPWLLELEFRAVQLKGQPETEETESQISDRGFLLLVGQSSRRKDTSLLP